MILLIKAVVQQSPMILLLLIKAVVQEAIKGLDKSSPLSLWVTFVLVSYFLLSLIPLTKNRSVNTITNLFVHQVTNCSLFMFSSFLLYKFQLYYFQDCLERFQYNYFIIILSSWYVMNRYFIKFTTLSLANRYSAPVKKPSPCKG